jgi:hypothetical protein
METWLSRISGRSIANTDFLGTQSEFPCLHVTAVTNDEVQEYHAGLFAFDPIWRIGEWRFAMLADPNHTRKFSKQDAIPIAEQLLSARGSIVSLKEPCLGCAVIKTFVKIGVGIGHTATGGKFLRRGQAFIDQSSGLITGHSLKPMRSELATRFKRKCERGSRYFPIHTQIWIATLPISLKCGISPLPKMSF